MAARHLLAAQTGAGGQRRSWRQQNRAGVSEGARRRSWRRGVVNVEIGDIDGRNHRNDWQNKQQQQAPLCRHSARLP